MRGGDRSRRARWLRWAKFVIGGAANTGLSYGVYFGLHFILEYQLAYLIAYAAGVVFSYVYNARFVFHVPLSLRGVFAYPVVYVVQYAGSALLLGGLVEGGVSRLVAPLVVAAAMLPVTYLLSRQVLAKWSRGLLKRSAE